MYPEVLPSIQAWLVLHGHSLPEAVAEYHQYQRDKRHDSGEEYGFAVYELGPPTATPFASFREAIGLSRMGFAKHFCVHPGLLYRVEQGISKTLPEQLADALKEAGLAVGIIDELRYRIEEAVCL